MPKNQVLSINIAKKDTSIIVSPRLKFESSEQIKEAIDNGIRVYFIAKSQLYEQKQWWFDAEIANKKINLVVYYFSLGNSYVIKNIDSGEQFGFNDYQQIWKEFEKAIQFEFNQQTTEKSWIKLRVMLDKGGLPTAMQLPVIFDDQWDVSTDWQQKKVNK